MTRISCSRYVFPLNHITIALQITYSSLPNRCSRMFISCKVCLLTSIEDKRQTLPEIKVHACLFGTLEYPKGKNIGCHGCPYMQVFENNPTPSLNPITLNMLNLVHTVCTTLTRQFTLLLRQRRQNIYLVHTT